MHLTSLHRATVLAVVLAIVLRGAALLGRVPWGISVLVAVGLVGLVLSVAWFTTPAPGGAHTH